MLLPSVSLAVVMVPTYLRVLRSDLVSTTREDFLVAVRARGLPGRRVLFGHALRPSGGGLATVVGAQLGVLLGYVLVIEELFTLPGLGDHLQTALARRDRPVVLGVVAAVSALVVLANLAADVVVAALDPRVARVSARRPNRAARPPGRR
jgi:peptide/nickel transport system permease protein